MNQSTTQFPFVLCQVEPPRKTDGGDYCYRTQALCMAMAREKGVFVVTLTNEHRRKWKIAAQADVLILKNICDPDFLPLIRQRKAQGKVTVYEISEDLGSIEAWNPAHFSCGEYDNLTLVRRLAGLCDALQVTCSPLKDMCEHMNPNCRLFRDQVSHVPPERIYRGRNGLVVGWEESHGNLQDMDEIAEPLSDWIMSRPDASLCLMASDPIWRLFKGLPQEKKRLFPMGSVESYYDFLRHIDVGIGPLRDTPLNHCRSDLKFLEYAVSGVVPVMKRLEPYMDTLIHGETGFLYTQPRDLMETLTLLAGDPILLEGVAKTARRYVLQNRLESDHAPERIEFYRDLLLKTLGASDCRHLSEQVNGWAAMDGAVTTGRYIRLEPTKFELLLKDGLATMQISNCRESTFRLFRRASAVEPDNYLPHLYGASVSPNPVESLMKAIELNTNSLKARIMLGDALIERGNIWEALRWFQEAAEVFPEYELPYSRAASLLDRAGQSDQANLYTEKAFSILFAENRLPARAPDSLPPTALHT